MKGKKIRDLFSANNTGVASIDKWLIMIFKNLKYSFVSFIMLFILWVLKGSFAALWNNQFSELRIVR